MAYQRAFRDSVDSCAIFWDVAIYFNLCTGVPVRLYTKCLAARMSRSIKDELPRNVCKWKIGFDSSFRLKFLSALCPSLSLPVLAP